ncbi:MAG TPA: hypothetical protein VER03_06755 [Bryobacteraceae bacterium]|nr:hypothetical protein [Bryobacteraceae bacterium]
MNRILVILLAFSFTLAADADSETPYQASALIDRYRSALAGQQDALKNMSMEVHMEGRIPKLKKEGKMSALRMISSLGKITYKVVGFWGDDTVKKEVMARYMTAEVEAASDKPKKDEHNIAITPENYEFKYKGLSDRNNTRVHVFELKPRHKRLGLFKGELWLDPDTCLPLHEGGRLVKSPSVWVKKMEFARYYEIIDGVSYLKRMETKTDTRIVGKAELNIEYANFHKQTDEAVVEPVAGLR